MQIEPPPKPVDEAGAFPAARVALTGVIAVFVIGLLPAITSYAYYTGDERFYTDAALRMVVSGDYISPYFGDGSLRFTKPALVYWILSANYHVMGVSMFTSRLPFLLAGALTLVITYKIGTLLFNDNAIGAVAAAILASNITFIKISTRATPDIILVLFFSLSVYGFIALSLAGRLKSRYFLMAYGGAGTAIAAKGLLGFFPLLYAFLYSLVRRKRTAGIRSIVRLRYVVLCLFIGVFWFLLVFILHGREVFSVFLSDQVGDKVVQSRWQALSNFASFTLAPLRHFFPWSLVALAAALARRKVIAEIFRENRESLYYVAGIFLLMVITFSGSDDLRTRYLAPSYPLIASFFASVIVRTVNNGERARLVVRRFSLSFMAFMLALSLFLVYFGFLVHPLLLAGGAVFCLLALALFIWVLRDKRSSGLIATAIVLLTANIIVNVSIREAFTHSPAMAMAERINEESFSEPRVAVVDISNHYPAQIRILLKGRGEFREFSRSVSIDSLSEYDMVLVSEQYAPTLREGGYSVEKCGFEYDRWSTEETISLSNERDVESRFAEKRIYYYFAVKKLK